MKTRFPNPGIVFGFLLTFLLLLLPPKALAQPVSWHTDYAYLEADKMVIKANGREFPGSMNVYIHSDPGDDYRTTLEVQWWDQGVEMRFHLYFAKEGGNWRVTEMRTYNGLARGDWIYYDGFAGGKTNVPLTGNFTFNPKNGQNGQIILNNLKLLGFPARNFPTPSSYGYFLDIPYDPIIMTNQINTGFGVNAILRNSQNQIVTDQSKFYYVWTADDPNVVKIYAQALFDTQGQCLYQIKLPCPQIHADLTGKNPGTTKVRVKVLEKDTNVIVAEKDITVTVYPAGTIPFPYHPTMTPAPTVIVLPTAATTPILLPSATPIILQCNQKCYYSFRPVPHCAGNLQCLPQSNLDGSDVCRNPNCPEKENCLCALPKPSSQPTATPMISGRRPTWNKNSFNMPNPPAWPIIPITTEQPGETNMLQLFQTRLAEINALIGKLLKGK